MVRSVVPDNYRLVGKGTIAWEGSNFAVITAVTGVPPVFVAGGALTARELLLPPPHADNSSDDESAKSKLSLACIWKSPRKLWCKSKSATTPVS
jgi:hypothetical protein